MPSSTCMNLTGSGVACPEGESAWVGLVVLIALYPDAQSPARKLPMTTRTATPNLMKFRHLHPNLPTMNVPPQRLPPHLQWGNFYSKAVSRLLVVRSQTEQGRGSVHDLP